VVSSSSLSTGAKAGIGAGVGAAGLGIVGILSFFFRRRYVRKRPVKQVDTRLEYPSQQSQTYQNPAWRNLTSTYKAREGSTGFAPKPELFTPEQLDPRFALERAGTHPYVLAANEVRRELGIMP
jgi:hypothetical protein